MCDLQVSRAAAELIVLQAPEMRGLLTRRTGQGAGVGAKLGLRTYWLQVQEVRQGPARGAAVMSGANMGLRTYCLQVH